MSDSSFVCDYEEEEEESVAASPSNEDGKDIVEVGYEDPGLPPIEWLSLVLRPPPPPPSSLPSPPPPPPTEVHKKR